jgi:formylglycine-generating enzyme required for sulfatase activity
MNTKRNTRMQIRGHSITVRPLALLTGFLFLVAAFTLLAACAAPFAATGGDGTASLTIKLAGNSAPGADTQASVSRTILPAYPDLAGIVDNYEITLTSQYGFAGRTLTATPASPSVTVSDLEFGVWDVSVIGKKTDAATGQAKTTVSGAQTGVNLASGGAVSLSLILTPVQTAVGTGNLSMKISFPDASADALSWRLDKTDGTNAVAPTPAAVTGNLVTRSATVSATGLASGNYTLVLSFTLAGEGVGIFRESVTIWDGFTSDKWIDGSGAQVATRTFAASDFFDASAALSGLVFTPQPSCNYAFAPETITYDLSTCSQSSLRFSPTEGIQGQTIGYRWNGTASDPFIAVFSGTAPPALALKLGANTLEVRVTAANKTTTKTYSCTIYGTGNNGSGIPQYTSSSGMKLVQIPGGSFWRDGSGNSISTVNPFLMSKYLVTQAQFNAVTGVNPSNFQLPVDTSRPVEMVSWYDAVEYCNKLSLAESLPPVYTITGRNPATGYPITAATVTADLTKCGYRLPTYTEWVWCAIGADTANPGQPNTTGHTLRVDTAAKQADLNTYAWTADNASAITHAVGQKRPDSLGLYDMFGNVSKWVWDLDALPAGGNGSTINYQGGSPGSGRHFITGGHFSISASVYTTVYMGVSAWTTGPSANTLGFRVVRNTTPLYRITYNGNGNTGGSEPVDHNAYQQGANITVLGNSGGLVNAGKIFLGWNTMANRQGSFYRAGDPIALGGTNLVLYAHWADVYVSGSQELVAGYWLNGTWNELPEVSTGIKALKAWAISVVSGNVHVLGTWWDGDDHRGSYWLKGTSTDLYLSGQTSTGHCSALGMTVTDAGVVHAIGQSRDFSSSYYSVPKWTGGSAVIIDNIQPYQTGCGGYAIAVAGSNILGVGYLGGSAMLWKNSTRVFLPGGSVAFGIAVSTDGKRVVIAGANASNQAVYWESKNGGTTWSGVVPVTAAGSGNSFASGVFIDGSDLYLCGSDGTNAVYWKNPVDYPNATQAENGKVVLGTGQATAIKIAMGTVCVIGTDITSEIRKAAQFYPGCRKAYLWVNGAQTTLAAGSTNETFASDLVVVP